MNRHKWLFGILITLLLFVFCTVSWLTQEKQNGESNPQTDQLSSQGQISPPAAPVVRTPPEISLRPQNSVQPQRSQSSARPKKTAATPGQAQPKPEQPTSTAEKTGLTDDERIMLDMVNQARKKNGAGPLSINMKLTRAARAKADDMIAKNYFSHTSPTFGSPFDMMRNFGISYRTAGENLAGAGSVAAAHSNLMNSPGHRANILNSSYREIGIGVVSGGQYGKIYVQLFIG
ncbi:MAG TPA: hypothetical protein DEF36_03235 [Desulfotomaculum sp.]|nr:hypothetical protein [Desulfotomaculum sp.]